MCVCVRMKERREKKYACERKKPIERRERDAIMKTSTGAATVAAATATVATTWPTYRRSRQQQKRYSGRYSHREHPASQ